MIHVSKFTLWAEKKTGPGFYPAAAWHLVEEGPKAPLLTESRQAAGFQLNVRGLVDCLI